MAYNQNIYMQFANCIPLKGASRGIFYDLQRGRHLLVSNFLIDDLIANQNKIVIDSLDEEYKEYLDCLVEEGWGMYLDEKTSSLFPPLSKEWHHFAKITNAQVDFFNNKTDFDFFFTNTLPQFDTLICKDFQINFLELISFKELLSFLISFNDTDVNSLNIFLPYSTINDENLDELFEKQPRLNDVFFYNSPDNFISKSKKNIAYIKNDITKRNDAVISPVYFCINMALFTESQCHNTYYNRKVCIDAFGNIKNSPEHSTSFGNINNTSLESAIMQKGFDDYWYISKDLIDVCKDCEFRHMCVDACVPVKRENNTWYRCIECNYNPYINKWAGEDNYRSLEESGVTVNFKDFEIDQKKLHAVNKELWGND